MTISNKNDQRDLFRGALEIMILRSLLRQLMHGSLHSLDNLPFPHEDCHPKHHDLRCKLHLE